jgi:hypothetical protein
MEILVQFKSAGHLEFRNHVEMGLQVWVQNRSPKLPLLPKKQKKPA